MSSCTHANSNVKSLTWARVPLYTATDYKEQKRQIVTPLSKTLEEGRDAVHALGG